MFFYLSKLVWLVSAPANALLLLLALALFLPALKRRPIGRHLAALAAVGLLATAFSPLGTGLLRILEDRFPQPAPDLKAPTGIIVLGGSTDEVVSDGRDQVTIVGAATRLTAAVELARRFPSARLVFSGGSAALLLRPRTEAEDTLHLWTSLGVSAQRITLEDRSRNTYENGLYTRGLIDPKPGERWLLVTSAWHMPRAVGVFRAVGFPIVPYPVDYRTAGTASGDFIRLYDAVEGLRRFDTASRELVGLFAYRLTGKTDALFPAPDGAR